MEGVRLVLASASPRRRDLLAAAGLRFAVEPAHADESLPAGTPGERAARLLAERKAEAVARRWRGADVLVLGADTVVALGGEGGEPERLLGKPEDAEEAARMLRALSGTTHRVITGVCVVAAARDRRATRAECTRVTMRPLAESEVEAYVRSGEWRDKAGGYAIQESADAFVTRLEGGGFDNVVGLPVTLCLDLLRELGGLA